MDYLIEKVNNINIILSVAVIICFILFTESVSYSWHRWATHRDILPYIFGIQDSHDIHHRNGSIGRGNDFVYISLILFMGVILLATISFITGLSTYVCLLIYVPAFITFVWNWYIHDSYHIKNHWLNKYKWFRKDKQIHFQHHYNSNKNYGIASHFTDKIFGTFDKGKPNRKTDEELYYDKKTLKKLKNHLFYRIFGV